MPSADDGNASEPLLAKAERVVKESGKTSAGAVESRIARIRNKVQARRDAPSVLLGCAVFFGVLSGLVAYVYSAYFEGMLWVVWEVRAADCNSFTVGFYWCRSNKVENSSELSLSR